MNDEFLISLFLLPLLTVLGGITVYVFRLIIKISLRNIRERLLAFRLREIRENMLVNELIETNDTKVLQRYYFFWPFVKFCFFSLPVITIAMIIWHVYCISEYVSRNCKSEYIFDKDKYGLMLIIFFVFLFIIAIFSIVVEKFNRNT